MKQTENYKLSQWAPEDRVLRNDFNADNAKLDTALSALTAEGPRLDAAIAAVRTENSAALAAEAKRVDTELAKKALASDLSTAKSALEAAVSRLEGDKLEFVTLHDSTHATVANLLNYNVVSLKLGQYAVVSLEFQNLPQDCTLGINGNSGICFYAGGFNENNGLIASMYAGTPAQVLLFPMRRSENRINAISFTGSICWGYSTVTYDTLKYFQLKGSGNFNSAPVSVRITAIK